jgi:hypothetical protein
MKGVARARARAHSFSGVSHPTNTTGLGGFSVGAEVPDFESMIGDPPLRT